ncbi:MAG: exo-alpha-sialidase [Planctomycetes bacterium]|nr:exo-alpha-sialidase [Planctomycetota bacterium]
MSLLFLRCAGALRSALLLSVPLAGLPAQILEKPGDGPLDNPRAGGAGVASTSIVTRGPFVSRQVNVDASGANIPNDAANEPSIGIDPTNPANLVAGWRQFDNVASNFRQAGYAYSHDGGLTWTHPGSLQPGFFNSDPVVDTDANGVFFYLGYPSGSTLNLFRSATAGTTWTGPVVTPGGDKAWMTIDKGNSIGRGHIYIMWQVASGPNTFTRSTNGGASFSPAIPVTNTPTFGTIAVDDSGTLYAAGLRGQRFSSFLMARSTNAKDPAQTPTFTTVSISMGGSLGFSLPPNPGGLLGQAQVAVDPSRPGYVYELCSVVPTSGPNAMDVHIVRSTNGGLSFGAPVRVNDDPASGAWHWFGTFSVAPDGRIDVVWNDTRSSGVATLCETRYAYSLDAGQTFSRSTPICPQFDSTVGWPNQNKIGDYYDMRSDAAAANLIYSATHNGEQDVWFVRVGDCNDNGAHDSTDIATGFSFDSNADTIPDECQFRQTELGSGTGLHLLVGGDDLTQPGSRATVQVQDGPANSPVFLVVSVALLANPLPLPGGGLLLADPTAGFAAVAANTNALGKLGLTIQGGPSAIYHLYLQAAMLSGMNLLVSNAVDVQLGR